MLQDPTQAGSAEDPISDFCAPLWTESTLQGTAGGATFRGNPGDGTYNFVSWVLAAPDYDGDGIENGLDPCFDKPNASGWDPRATLIAGQHGDEDADGLPNDCDPNPAVASLKVSANGVGLDEDGDGWQNRGDNCPLVPNPEQTDTDSDGIGDACDPHEGTRDGEGLPICEVTTVTIGSGGPTPADPQGMAPCDLNATIPSGATATPAPTPTVNPSTGVRPTNAPSTGGLTGGPSGGIGTLAPSGTGIPAWAAMLAALGTLGLCFGFGLMGTRLWRRR